MIDVDVTICRNVERLFNNLPGSDVRHIRLECACSCEGVRAATSNRYNLIIRFNHIPLSRDKQQGVFIHNHKESFKFLRSEEHTSELQSRGHLVCRLLPEKKNYSS